MLRWIAVILILMFVVLQWKLWVGDNGVRKVHELRSSVAAQKKENQHLQQRNQALAADVQGLKHAEQAVESRARSELGLIKPGETFYQVVPATAASSAQPAGGH